MFSSLHHGSYPQGASINNTVKEEENVSSSETSDHGQDIKITQQQYQALMSLLAANNNSSHGSQVNQIGTNSAHTSTIGNTLSFICNIQKGTPDI